MFLSESARLSCVCFRCLCLLVLLDLLCEVRRHQVGNHVDLLELFSRRWWKNSIECQHVFVLQEPEYFYFPQSSSNHARCEVGEHDFLDRYHIVFFFLTFILLVFLGVLAFHLLLVDTTDVITIRTWINFLCRNYDSVGSLSNRADDLVFFSNVEYSAEHDDSTGVCLIRELVAVRGLRLLIFLLAVFLHLGFICSEGDLLGVLQLIYLH